MNAPIVIDALASPLPPAFDSLPIEALLWMVFLLLLVDAALWWRSGMARPAWQA